MEKGKIGKKERMGKGGKWGKSVGGENNCRCDFLANLFIYVYYTNK